MGERGSILSSISPAGQGGTGGVHCTCSFTIAACNGRLCPHAAGSYSRSSTCKPQLHPKPTCPECLECTAPLPADLGEASNRKLQSFKGRGEETLRNSGLGYTIVRPGPLKEEAGGYKALVFDQGNRIRQVCGGWLSGRISWCGWTGVWGREGRRAGVFALWVCEWMGLAYARDLGEVLRCL